MKNKTFLSILVIGLILRVWGITFGLPFQFHQDEPIVVNHALAYGSGDLNPHFFAIPPLTSYLLFFIYGVLFLIGKLIGIWQGTEGFVVQFFKDPSIFYIVGRFFIGVVPSMACIVGTYLLGKRLFRSTLVPLYASAIMAFSFINVINAHYIYTDMLLVMFSLFAVHRLLLLYDSASIKDYLIAGVFIGLAIGVKYNGVLLLFPYFVTHIVATLRRKKPLYEVLFSPAFILGGITSIMVFLLTNPFLMLDFSGFSESILKQSGAFWYMGWAHHISYSLVQGISIVFVILGIVGLLLIFLRKGDLGKIFVSFPILFYLVLVFRSQPFFRYVLLLVPFLALASAYLIFEVVRSISDKKTFKKAATCVAIVLLVPTFLKSVNADILLSSRDTRVEAADWIRENLPEGTAIACDSTVFRPSLNQPYSQMEDKKEFLDTQSGLAEIKNRKLQFQMRALDKKDKGYPIYFLFNDPRGEGQFLSTIPALPFDVDRIKSENIKYVTVNGQAKEIYIDRFIETLEANAEVVIDFSPYEDNVFRDSVDSTAKTCIPVSDRELYSRRKTGPSIRIYKIK